MNNKLTSNGLLVLAGLLVTGGVLAACTDLG